MIWNQLFLTTGITPRVIRRKTKNEKRNKKDNHCVNEQFHPQGLGPFLTGQWNIYAQNADSNSHLFGTSQGSGTAILTFLKGFHPQTLSLWLIDIVHHL